MSQPTRWRIAGGEKPRYPKFPVVLVLPVFSVVTPSTDVKLTMPHYSLLTNGPDRVESPAYHFSSRGAGRLSSKARVTQATTMTQLATGMLVPSRSSYPTPCVWIIRRSRTTNHVSVMQSYLDMLLSVAAHQVQVSYI